MSVRIIVDSTADLVPQAAERVKIVHLSIRYGAHAGPGAVAVAFFSAEE